MIFRSGAPAAVTAPLEKNPLSYFSTFRNSVQTPAEAYERAWQGRQQEAEGGAGRSREAAAGPADELQLFEPAEPLKRYMKVIHELLPRHPSN